MHPPPLMVHVDDGKLLLAEGINARQREHQHQNKHRQEKRAVKISSRFDVMEDLIFQWTTPPLQQTPLLYPTGWILSR